MNKVLLELPYWTGATLEKRQCKLLGFGIEVNQFGFISQNSDSIDTFVINNYSSDDYNFITTCPGESNWGDSLAAMQIDFIQNQISNQNLKVLEIGSGNDYLGKYFIGTGFARDYVIVDPSIKSVSSHNLRIIKDYFNHKIEPQEPDLVICINCLEHVDHPVDFLKNIYNQLKPQKGQLILIVPDVERLMNVGGINCLLHEHISYFTKDSLQNIMNYSGFEISYIESHNDSLRVAARVVEEPTALNIDFSNQITYQEQLFASFKLKYEERVSSLREMIQEEMKTAGKIYFHGANNGLNIFLKLTALDDNENVFVFDNDENKIGKYIQCTKNPIMSPVDVVFDDEQKIFISACTFFEEIKKSYENIDNFNKLTLIPMFD